MGHPLDTLDRLADGGGGAHVRIPSWGGGCADKRGRDKLSIQAVPSFIQAYRATQLI